MPTRSGLDFGTVHDELSYWLNHTSSYFKGGQNGSGENGNDFAMPTGTPVYAVTSGTVVGSGYYGGGGVVSVQQYPGRVWYYQHLDQNVVNATTNGAPTQVTAGQLIGYSGGQNVGGNHPSQLLYSSYPHIEVGIDAPWGGIWGGGNNKVNGVAESIDPRPQLEAMLTASATGDPIATGGRTQGGIPSLFAASSTMPGGFIGFSSTTDQAGTGAGKCTAPGPFDGAAAWGAYLACLSENGNGVAAMIGQGIQAGLNATGFGLFGQILGDPIRMIKLVFGAFLIFASVVVLILPETAAAAVAAAGAPEAAPGVYEALKHPTQAKPHRIIASSIQQRAQQKQNVRLNYRYYRQAQQQEQARQQKQAAKAQAQQQQAPPSGPQEGDRGPFLGVWKRQGKSGHSLTFPPLADFPKEDVLAEGERIQQRMSSGKYKPNTREQEILQARQSILSSQQKRSAGWGNIDDILKDIR